MHRYDATCHWCGEVKSPWRISGPALRSVAAIALTVTAAAGAWRYGPAIRDVTTDLAASARAMRTQEQGVGPVTESRALPAEGSATGAADAALGEAPGDSVTMIALGEPAELSSSLAAVSGASVDSVVWTPAVARTWVNVRSDASRGGEVVGVIKPESRAMLGTDRGGWRQVRLSDVTGWVDPKLFEPDSLRTRGE